MDSVARLTALGLVRKVLGCCEITRAGQLTFHRHHFLKVSRGRVARVTRRDPLFLQETRFGVSVSRARFTDFLRMRRRSHARAGHRSRLPKWLMRLASDLSG